MLIELLDEKYFTNDDQDAVRVICNEVEELVRKCGKPKLYEAIKLPPHELYKHVEVCIFPFSLNILSFYRYR